MKFILFLIFIVSIQVYAQDKTIGTLYNECEQRCLDTRLAFKFDTTLPETDDKSMKKQDQEAANFYKCYKDQAEFKSTAATAATTPEPTQVYFKDCQTLQTNLANENFDGKYASTSKLCSEGCLPIFVGEDSASANTPLKQCLQSCDTLFIYQELQLNLFNGILQCQYNYNTEIQKLDDTIEEQKLTLDSTKETELNFKNCMMSTEGIAECAEYRDYTVTNFYTFTAVQKTQQQNCATKCKTEAKVAENELFNSYYECFEKAWK